MTTYPQNMYSWPDYARYMTAGAAALNNGDICSLIKYKNGIKSEPDSLASELGLNLLLGGIFAGGMGTWQVGSYALKNRKSKRRQDKGFFDAYKETYRDKNHWKTLSNPENFYYNELKAARLKELGSLTNLDPTKYKQKKEIEGIINQARTLKDRLTGLDCTNIKEISAIDNEVAELLKQESKQPLVKVRSKLWRFIKNPFKPLSKMPFFKTLGASALFNNSIIKNLCKFGAGPFALFGGVISLFTEVIPTFAKLGPVAGIKQLMKSAVHVGLDTAGFIVGQQLGAFLGGLVGLLFPPAAPILAFVGGMLGGFVASGIAGYMANSVIGKSELEISEEKATEKAVNNEAKEIMNGGNGGIKTLIIDGYVKALTERQQGYQSSEIQKAIDIGNHACQTNLVSPGEIANAIQVQQQRQQQIQQQMQQPQQQSLVA